MPNFQSWQSRLFRRRWFHLDPPRHLLHFEPRHAGRLPRARRPRRLRVGGASSPSTARAAGSRARSTQVLPHPNYLYELVKDRGALAGMTPLARALHLTGSLVAGAPVLALSLPLEAAASVADRGAALTVAARRAS